MISGASFADQNSVIIDHEAKEIRPNFSLNENVMLTLNSTLTGKEIKDSCKGWVSDSLWKYDSYFTKQSTRDEIYQKIRGSDDKVVEIELKIFADLRKDLQEAKQKFPQYKVLGIKKISAKKITFDFGYSTYSGSIGFNSLIKQIKSKLNESLVDYKYPQAVKINLNEWDFVCDLYMDTFEWNIEFEVEADDRTVAYPLLQENSVAKLHKEFLGLEKVLQKSQENAESKSVIVGAVIEEALQRIKLERKFEDKDIIKVLTQYFDSNLNVQQFIKYPDVVEALSKIEVFPVSYNKSLNIDENNSQWKLGGEQ